MGDTVLQQTCMVQHHKTTTYYTTQVLSPLSSHFK